MLTNKSARRSYARGFTIVELLVVITVIAILAAISVVAYTGIQQRAHKTKIVSETGSMLTLLRSYQALNGAYPSTSTVCLGAGYTDQTGDGVPDCRWGSGNVNPSTSFNQALNEVGSSQVSVDQRAISYGSGRVVGMYFSNDSLGTLDGNPQRNWLVYVVPDKTCGRTVPILTSTYPQFESKDSDTVSENWGSGGLCWVPLPE